MPNILAIDYGQNNIGLAMSVNNLTFAVPLQTIKNDVNTFLLLKDIIRDESISLIIVGYPHTINNYISERHSLICNFVNDLKENTKLEVIFEDESYSSVLSNKVQKEFNIKNKQINKNKDAISAQLILERYLMRIGK